MQGRMTAVFVLLASAAVLLAHVAKAEPVVLRTPLAALPMDVGRWHGTQAPDFEPAVRDALGVDEYINRTYTTTDNASVGLYVGFYESQRRGRTMHSPLNCLPGAGWQPTSHDLISIDGLPGRAITVNRYIVAKGLDRLLVLYWYQAHDRVVANEYWARFYLAADALRLNRTDGALVRIATPLEDGGDIGRAERRAVEFAAKFFPILRHSLPA
jgi:EpsI family protein